MKQVHRKHKDQQTGAKTLVCVEGDRGVEILSMHAVHREPTNTPVDCVALWGPNSS